VVCLSHTALCPSQLKEMGISGLLPLLKEISVNGNIKEFAGKR
jgi:hypothetical protein